jgi:predicted permease
LTGAAAACGTALAWAGVRALVSIAPHDVPRLSQTSIDLPVLGMTLFVAVVAGCLSGLLPAFAQGGAGLQRTLTDSLSRTSGGRSRARSRRMLVVTELALAVVLVSGAGLLMRSFWQLQRVNPGFSTDGVVKAEYQLPATRYPVDFRVFPMFKEQHAFSTALVARASARPGVEAAAIAGNHPLDPGFTNSFTVVGREAEARTWPELSIRRVTPGYFRTVGLGLVRGRLLADADTTTAAPVALINESARRRFFPDQDPIGAQIRFWGSARRIVGVVADEKLRGLTEATPPAAYTPLAQTPSATGAGVLLVRASGRPDVLATMITSAIHEIDPALAVFGVEPLGETVSRSIGQRRFTMLLLASFAAVALLLATIGVHGLVAHGVEQRRREIGIRMAVGARPSDVMALFVREGLMLTAVGTALGLAGAVLLARFLSTMLFEVAPTDPRTYAGVAGLLTLVALAAIVSPARRATRTDPLIALRSE